MSQSTNPTRQVFDLTTVRRDFPILDQQVNGHRFTYLDNASSAQKPRAMLDAVNHYYSKEYANVHRGLHFMSNRLTYEYEQARRIVRDFLGAKLEQEIIFTANATDALNLVANGLGLNDLREGDEIILSQLEHHANIIPWHFLRERQGVVIKWLPIDDRGDLDPADLERLITPRTRVLAFTQMSNAIGTITPARELISIAKQHGIKTVVDGSQGAVHAKQIVSELDPDFYVATGHKLYGPTGIGILYGRFEELDRLPPYRGGGEMINEVFEDRVTYAQLPARLEAGTPQIVQAIALGASLSYLESFGLDEVSAHEHALHAYARERLGEIAKLVFHGNPIQSGPILSIAIEGVHPHDLSTLLDQSGVAVRAGTHCAMPLMHRFGITSSCRVSLAMYNGRDDIDSLVKAVEIAKKILL